MISGLLTAVELFLLGVIKSLFRKQGHWIPRMLLILFFISLCFSRVSPATNDLTVIYTIVSGINDFPEATSTAIVNGVTISYRDSKTHRCIPRLQFIKEYFDMKFWDYITDLVIEHTEMANKTLNVITKRTNQTSGIHTLQWIHSVEVSDGGSVKRSMRFGFDGKDYISLDPDRMRWIATNHFAVMTKEEWDSDESWNNYWETQLHGIFVEHLKRYLEAGKEYFTRKVQPEVFISRREPNGQDKPLTLSCLVTGFDPVDIEVTWLRNGEVMSETHSSGVRPNHDGTHQIQKEIEINAGDEDQYSCQIEHSSLAEAQLYQWEIPENSVLRSHLILLIGLIAALATIFGIIIWKRPWRGSPSGTYTTAPN
ncbi:class I histocompatibility antigen, F10 alpha chain-like isoform X2 [Chiloscyllium punctatum]|uniref:class I histocompatibility antigen, F10 alpha chain-like isoform X2 n=1 Tax=Chiloscyllium punctatum TaxID=137246 RepID=UPI003B63E130